MKPEFPVLCETCKRDLPLSFHHLIPKKMHDKRVIQSVHPEIDFANYGIWICLDCHKKIHKLFDHHQLATTHYTLARLMADAKLRKFISWVSKQRKRVK